MSLRMALDLLNSMNLFSVRLLMRDREQGRAYISRSIRHFRDLTHSGLPLRDPIAYICEQNWGNISPSVRVELPPLLTEEGGTDLAEWLYLAAVTRVLQPQKVFEIGTYTGHTTVAFILNTPPGSEIFSLDLPTSDPLQEGRLQNYIDTDITLVKERPLGRYIRQLGLENRYHQLLCDSTRFDASPHRHSVELGFIDGAHTLPYVQNDTRKMAEMMANRGLVFWHDYGGSGRFRPLAEYLEKLAQVTPIYRIEGTSLAWTSARELCRLFQKTQREFGR